MLSTETGKGMFCFLFFFQMGHGTNPEAPLEHCDCDQHFDFANFFPLLKNTVIASLQHFAFHLDDSCDTVKWRERVATGLLGLDGLNVNANCSDTRSFGESPFGPR